MQAFLIYTAKAAAALAVFYLFFRLLLSRETFHRLNRLMLLAGLAASLLLPLCIITVRVPRPEIAAPVTAVVSVPRATGPDGWVLALGALYLLGVLFALVRLALAFGRVRRLIRTGEHHARPDGTIIVVRDTPEGAQEPSPSSWMHYIFLGRKDFDAAQAAGFDGSSVYTHEAAHLSLHHSWDLLLLDLCTLFQWFNPAVWLLRRELTALHEYEADKAVLDRGFSPRDYQLMLVRKAMSDAGYSIANNLNHSTLKGRIDMMLRQPSRSARAWKLAVLLPLLGAGLALNARTLYVAPSAPDGSRVVRVTAEPIGDKVPHIVIRGDSAKGVTIRLDGREIDSVAIKQIDPHTIHSIDVQKTGDGGGIIDIHTKQASSHHE